LPRGLRSASKVDDQVMSTTRHGDNGLQLIPYGAQQLSFNVPNGTKVADLQSLVEHPTRAARDVARASLAEPIGSPRLREIARDRHSAAILIPGKTRVAGTRDYLPPLLDELNEAGIADENIEIFLATGTHEPHIDNDVDGLLGPEVAARVRCVAHDCKDDNNLQEVGTTRAGTPVFFNRRVLQAGVKILTGRVVPHYFAGFSGGRKAMLPGVAGFETIRANHRLTIHPERGLHPEAVGCSLRRNPVHLDMVEAAEMGRPDFTLNTMMCGERNLAHATSGDVWQAHASICALAKDLLRIRVPQPVDALITSPGGEPSDCNFMQSLKALFNFKDIVRPGGAMLWVAECPHGMHPGFLDFGTIESDDSMEGAVRTRYALTGHNSLMLRQLLRRVNVAMVSALPHTSVASLGIHPVASIEEGVCWLQDCLPSGFEYAVAREANVICAALDL
jgi:nickel-dependent lactate racemase